MVEQIVIAMLKHNILFIYRSLVRFRSTFLINLFGLSTGLACTLLIYLWVNDELKVDKFHHDDEQLFQLMSRSENAQGVEVGSTMAPVVADVVVDEFPEVAYAVMEARIPGKFTFAIDGNFFKEQGMYAGKDYFHVFSYELIQGDRNNVLSGENSIVISDAMAKRIFNTTDNVVGQTMTLQDRGELMITGVYTVPEASSNQFDFILPFDLQFKHFPNLKNDWTNTWANAYVRLKSGSSPNEFNTKIRDLITKKSGQENVTLFARSYSDAYLHGNYENGVQSGGRIEYVNLFSIIAIFIVAIASINFMNLSTAKATRRLKEVGIKKAIGASRKTLIYQYIGESMAMTFLSVIAALVIVYTILPEFNITTGKNLSIGFNADLIIATSLITIITGFVSGMYPAIYLSGFNPVSVLKGKLHTSFSEVVARKGLIVFQFMISVMLIAGVLVVHRQMDMIQHKNPGYAKENVIHFEMEGKVKEQREAFLEEVKKIPGVVNASSTFLTFFGNLNSTPDISWQGKDPNVNIEMQYRRVNYDLIEVLGIKMKEGQSFSKSITSDVPKIIFNETAIEMMGITDPVGKIVKLGQREMEIVGVTEDFHFESLHEKVKPLFFNLTPDRTNTLMIKIESGNEDETLARLGEFHQSFSGMPMDFRFLDEKFQSQYDSERRVAVLSNNFALLAVLISCLGLFGLVTFTAERKTREIGIRKILGSGNWNIIYLLSADFTKMVVVAIVIALPLSYWLTEKWLSGFAYRIDLDWWIFIASGLIALGVAWATIGVQAIKAAMAEPVKSLRSE